MTLWYQCYHCWCCTLMISCISMRAAAITPGSGSLREALNSACRWETVVGEMSWKWCIANSAFLRTSSLCEQWSWYYHHLSVQITKYHHWSITITIDQPLINIDHHWSQYQSPLIYIDHYWSLLININHNRSHSDHSLGMFHLVPYQWQQCWYHLSSYQLTHYH